MTDFVLIATTARIWYAIPLVVSVSLVYAATHHEKIGLILWRALRTALWIIGFMLITFVLLSLLQNAI
jgi:hypothetical protein